MSAVERDPAGLLERVPELARLAEAHADLRQAIEQGRPHAVYRALLWLRLRGKAGPDAALVRELLATRRLFIQPLNGAPSMVTYNGIGARVYGQAEPDASDGSHITTLYLVLVFVPVYPFSAYLVRSATPRGWTFFGKVPLSIECYLWQRAVALAGVVAVLIGAYNAFGSMRYNTVQIVNALPQAVEARVGSSPPLMVGARHMEAVRARIGVQNIVIKLNGRVIENGQVEVKRGYDIDVWNVLGAGPLYWEDVVYSAKGSSASTPAAEEPTLICGERTFLEKRVDYPFTTPPSTISMSETQPVTHRTRFALAELPPLYCVYKLSAAGKTAEAKALALSIADATNYDLEIVESLVAFFDAQHDSKQALDLADIGRKRDDSRIEYQRLYQAEACHAGLRAQVAQEFRERARAHPDSADDAYLLGRMLAGVEADQFVTETQARFPRHPYLLRSAAYRALWRGEYAEVERLVDELRPVDLKIWQEALDLELRALAGSGKVDKARSLAKDGLNSAHLERSSHFELVVDAQLLANFEPKANAGPALEGLLGDGDSETKDIRVAARVNAGATVSLAELESVQNKSLRSGLDLELKVRDNPDAALAQVLSSKEAPQGLSSTSWALLLCEAARRDAHHPALERLADWSQYGRAGTAALVAYVEHGTASDDLEDLEPEALAAADYVRSRAESPGSKERDALRSRAKREDALHGLISLAMTDWPE